MLAWTLEDASRAEEDGWYLSIGEPKATQHWLGYKRGCFASGAELHGHILRRAQERSPLHLKLLAFLYTHNRANYWLIMDKLPENSGGKLARTVVTMARISGASQE